MLYGLLIEGVFVEQQKQAALPANSAVADDEESSWLGMDAWVCCDSPQLQANA
jgi:hypothetical protein